MGLFGKKANQPKEQPGDVARKGAAMPADEALNIGEAFWAQGKHEDSVRYYRMAAEQGNFRAMNYLGCSYRFGEGVDKDTEKALHYFEASLAGGYSKAAGHIGQIYYDGEGGITCDYEKAVPFLVKSARAGNGFAMTTLSDAYYFGNGCDSNEKLAAYWAYQAVMHENDDGYYWLGMYFDEGVFFPECPAAAKYCFEKAAACGFDVDEYLEKYSEINAAEPDFIEFRDSDPSFFTQECPCRLYFRALALLDGRDADDNAVQIDAAEGQRLLELAAAQGYADAQYSLGAKFLNTGDGDGVLYDADDGYVVSLGCDSKKALHYLDLAARHGQPDALDALISLYSIGDTDVEMDIEKSDEYQAIKDKLFGYDDEDDIFDENDAYDDETEAEKGRYVTHVDYEGGDFYDGEYENDMRNGKGKYTYASGDIYEGDFVDDMFEGHGKYTYANGDVFEGEYRSDEMNGTGTYRATNGDTYSGDYLDGKRHGYGEFYNADNGSTYKGAWRNDFWHGVGKRVYSNGAWHFGQYVEGRTEGYGVYFDGTDYHIGLFENGSCVTEARVKRTMRNPVLTDIGDGTTCYCDTPKDPAGYAVFRGNGRTLYAKNDGSWVARYNAETKKMDLGAVDSQSRLCDDEAVTIYVDNLVAVGKIVAGVPNGRATMYYMSGETAEGEFENGKISAVIQMTDKFGHIKE